MGLIKIAPLPCSLHALRASDKVAQGGTPPLTRRPDGCAARSIIPPLSSALTLVLVLLLQCAMLLPVQAQKVPVVEKQLSNGMRLLLVERHDEPAVAGGWVAHVGSSNERPGITGTAHLFEHMMFKGTPTVGTRNYKLDLQIIAAQERLRDQMRQEEKKMRAEYRRGEIDDLLKPENKTERYQQLEKEFDQLVARQRDILVKN